MKQYKDRSYEDEYEGELEESDNESNNSNKKYRDNDATTIGSPKRTDKKVNLSINTSLNKSPVRTTKPVKKVDLGAAASFGVNEKVEKTPPGSDLLNDDFDPRASETPSEPKQQQISEFGDFENAFGSSANAPKKEEDDFADFSSAFNTTNSSFNPAPQSNANLLSSSPLINIPPMGSQPLGQLPQNPINNSQQTVNMFPIGPPTPVPSNNVQTGGNDLLGDLPGFSSLSIGSTNANVNNTATNSNNIFDMFDSGEQLFRY